MIEARATDVLAAMEAVLANEPYRLSLFDQVGDPLEGGALVFDVQGPDRRPCGGLAREATWAGIP